MKPWPFRGSRFLFVRSDDLRLPQLRMNSQFAQIQIHTTPAKLEITQPKAELKIQQPPAEVSIRTTPGKLEIDQTKAWEDMNLMSIMKRTDRFAEEGLQKVQQGNARRARQGTELMKIENGGNTIVKQAKENSFDGMKRLGLTFIPSHFSVKINYEPAKVDIEVKRNKPIIEATPQKVIHRYQPGVVETSLKQRNALEIDVVYIEI